MPAAALNGLSEKEALSRLKQFGRNEIKKIRGTPLTFAFLADFYNLFALLLWAAAGSAWLAGMPQLSAAIVGVIIINALFSFWQEFKAEKATEALLKILPSYAKVIRDGAVNQVLSWEIVPGDLLVLEEGDNICADAQVVEEFELRVNNSTLTGEFSPVRPSKVFAGTSVSFGEGKAQVYATGMNTEFGKIAHLTQTIKDDLSPLQKEMGRVTKIVAVFSVAMGIVFYFLGTYLGKLTPLQGFLFMIGIIVANVPEGLLPTISLALAMGVQRMAKRKALIKKLSSVETLGSTNVILTDKTGTLTMNVMAVKKTWSRAPREMHLAAALCNTAKLNEEGKIIGSPTEGALLAAAKDFGLDLNMIEKENPRRGLLPFDSQRKRMTSINQSPSGELTAYVKGAPEETLALCTMIQTESGAVELNEETRREILKADDSFAREALRVIAVAQRTLPQAKDFAEEDLVFLGLLAMMDPPRPGVEEAVKTCARAGIQVIMITGDYGLTAESFARQVGLVKEKCRVITGAELDSINDRELSSILKSEGAIFARVNPEHKLRIVTLLKGEGKIVAVTGDGVNDAPALKKADIGIAMGLSGTDVAKEAAEMILLDDNFATIVSAIEEGRGVYDNIKKFVTYILASNVPEIIPFIAFILFKIPLPLTIMQILAVDLGTDLAPALALGSEKPEPDVMERPPRPKEKRLLDFNLLARAYGWLGLIEGAAAMLAFSLIYLSPNYVYETATTMCLAAIVTSQIGNGFACRSERNSIFSIGLFSNRLYLFGIAIELALIGLLIYFPPLAGVFGLHPLTLPHWGFLLIFAPAILFLEELRKIIFLKWYNKRKQFK